MLTGNEDGLVEALYHFLWLTDDMKGKQPFNFMIPDTILYKYQQPIFWFFSSKQGVVLRKARSKLNSDKISKEFLKKKGPSGIVAYYIYNKKRSNHIIKELTKKKIEESGKVKVFHSSKDKR
jgi:hypothetical protein